MDIVELRVFNNRDLTPRGCLHSNAIRKLTDACQEMVLMHVKKRCTSGAKLGLSGWIVGVMV